MKEYNHKKIEKKWQAYWEKKKLNQATEDATKRKFYGLIEFPYPSGDGLHVGHIRSKTAMDIVARKRRAEGFEVLYPIGWDAFGLPTENYAIKTGIQPKIVTKKNTDTFRRQLKALGFSFDWSREINTTDPAYYKWTQWIFLKMFEKGLAYKKKMAINWCPKDKIGLANEEVVDGCCERCGTPVEKREKEQWMLAITKYADRLDRDLDTVDYLERIKIQQRNWIGKSEGMIFRAPVKDTDLHIETFSAHFEAFCADTFVVIAPDHSFLPKLLDGVQNKEEILQFAKNLLKKRLQRGNEEEKESEGVFTGRYIVDPVGNGDLPIWIASFALADYGTGIVKCSVHDERDFKFAKKYGLRLKPVLFPKDIAEALKVKNLEVCFSDMKNGVLTEPKEFEGSVAEGIRTKIVEYLKNKGLAKPITTYKLRDWIFSRQRYWGEPIPLIFCGECKKQAENHESRPPEPVRAGIMNHDKGGVSEIHNSKFIIHNLHFTSGEVLNPGWVAVEEKDLPVKLPSVKNYQPTDTGESPLAAISKWVNVKCPQCGGRAQRETDTMPNWAGSSWYYLAYIMRGISNFQFPISKYRKAFEHWLPVDWYNGGMEHTTLHLLYSRFWHKFLFDEGLVPTSEPYAKRTSHGLILAEGGEKMSKSKGNVVNPDSIIEAYGADTLRVYEMFMGPFDQPISWSTQNVSGARRFVEKVWRLGERIMNYELRIKNKVGDVLTASSSQLAALLNQTVKKVSEDIEAMKFNTAVSALMILANAFEKEETISEEMFGTFLQLLAPFAPHVTEELWAALGHRTSIHLAPWPKPSPESVGESRRTIVVQVNGKVRASFEATASVTEEEMKTTALALTDVKKWLTGQAVKKVIFVPGRLINFVLEEGETGV